MEVILRLKPEWSSSCTRLLSCCKVDKRISATLTPFCSTFIYVAWPEADLPPFDSNNGNLAAFVHKSMKRCCSIDSWANEKHIPALCLALLTCQLLWSWIRRGQKRKCAATSCVRPCPGERRREVEGNGEGRQNFDWWEVGDKRLSGWGTVTLLVAGDVSHRFTMQMKLPSMLQALLYSFFDLLHSWTLQLVFSHLSLWFSSTSHLSVSHS